MQKSIIKATFKNDIATVWAVVTDNNNNEWRSDLSTITVSEDGKQFTEYTQSNFATNFTITVKEPCSRYEFEMENTNMTGHWQGVFSETPQGGTQVIFTEEVEMRKPFMNFISRCLGMLKRVQKSYIKDLKKILGE